MTDDTPDTDADESTDGTKDEADLDAPWVFRLNPKKANFSCPRATDPELPKFHHRYDRAPEYRLIHDPDVAAALKEKSEANRLRIFFWMLPEDVDTALSSAKRAVEQIEAGEWDDVLHFLLFAEREHYGPRVTVLDAIENRHRVLKERQAGTEAADVLEPNDIVTAG